MSGITAGAADRRAGSAANAAPLLAAATATPSSASVRVTPTSIHPGHAHTTATTTEENR
jgi:hypothetical protein